MHYASFFNVSVVVQVVARLADVQEVVAYAAMNHASLQVVAFHVEDHHNGEAVCRVVAHHDVDHHHKHSRPNQS